MCMINTKRNDRLTWIFLHYSLASVNFLVFCVGATQTTRVLLYRQSLKNDTVSQEIGKEAKSEGNTLEAIAKDPQGAVEKAKKV